MLSDLMKNSISYNIKLATIIGVDSAVYIAALYYLSNSEKTKLNREQIKQLTGLSLTTQTSINKRLIESNIITYNETDQIITLNTLNISDIICEEDKTKLKAIQKIQKVKSDVNKPVKLNQRQLTIINLKNIIKANITIETPIGQQILDAYLDWVDGVYARPNGFLSKRAIELFIHKINEYSNGNPDIILELLNIATINGHRDADWTIPIYEQKPKKVKEKKIINPTINTIEVF